MIDGEGPGKRVHGVRSITHLDNGSLPAKLKAGEETLAYMGEGVLGKRWGSLP